MRAVFKRIQVLVVASAAFSGSAAQAADPDHGAEIAKRWCAACHLVEPGQKQRRRGIVRGDRGQSRLYPGEGGVLPARPASENAEFSIEPHRGGRSRRLHRRASQIRARRAQAPKCKSLPVGADRDQQKSQRTASGTPGGPSRTCAMIEMQGAKRCKANLWAATRASS